MSARYSGSPSKWRVVTALWGNRFVDRFLRTTLPTILAPGNLPALAEGKRVEFLLFTERSDLALLETTDLFRRLARLVKVESIFIDEVGGDGKYGRLSAVHKIGMDGAGDGDTGLIFLTPDAIWADGTLARIRVLAEQGFRAVVIDGPRAVRSGFFGGLAEFTHADGSIVISPRALIKSLLAHIHPFEASAHWHGAFAHDVPYQLHWTVPGEGILTRAFCKFPLYLRFDGPIAEFRGAIDHGLVDAAGFDEADIYHSIDSDEMAVVSVDDLGFSSANFKHTDKRDRILRAAKWALTDATTQNLKSILYPARRHWTEPTEARWRRVERLSGRHVGAILASRQILDVHRRATELGLTKAAGLIAFAFHARGLTGWLDAPRPRTYLVPSNLAFERAGVDSVDRLLALDRHLFVAVLRRHVLEGVVGGEDAARRCGVGIVREGLEAGDGVMHVVDRILAD